MLRTWFLVSLLPRCWVPSLAATEGLGMLAGWQAGRLVPQSCCQPFKQRDFAAAAPPADREGTVLDAPPLADALCHDPVLRHLKLVALPSDDSLLPRCGAALLLVLTGADCI
jgi:hypothetical protein